MSDDAWYADGECPTCGGRVAIAFACPGYQETQADGTKRIMVCAYGCSNATEYTCVGADPSDPDQDGCGWWYRTPNRRSTTKHNGVEMGPAPTAWEATNRG